MRHVKKKTQSAVTLNFKSIVVCRNGTATPKFFEISEFLESFPQKVPD